MQILKLTLQGVQNQLEIEKIASFMLEVLRRMSELKQELMFEQVAIFQRMKMWKQERATKRMLDNPEFTKKEFRDAFEDLLREGGFSVPDETDFDWSWKELLNQGVAFQDLQESYSRGVNVYRISQGALGLATHVRRDRESASLKTS